MELLSAPMFNKGSAFTAPERDALGLHGLLPPQPMALEDQIHRNYDAYCKCRSDLERHVFLRAIQDRNEVLFYALMRRHIIEMAPMIYAPTVAKGASRFSHLYRKPRGLFFSYPLRDRLCEILANRPYRDVDVIVVTDGERVLGIGDQGVGGMAISIGKLSLYTLMGGVHPSRTLPVVLDVGTNNAELREDSLYLGWRHERVTGDDYLAFVDAFVDAVRTELPDVLLQWEDFAKPHARPLLERYRDRLCTFNDDIQGTAAVALGAIVAALKASRQRLREQTVVIVGAGGAGTGVAEYLLAAMCGDGLSEAEARRRFYLVDVDGPLHDGMNGLSPVQRRFAQPRSAVAGWGRDGRVSLLQVMQNVDASVLIGTSGQPGLFTEDVVRAMAGKVEHPIIFPLSNPTERLEAQPNDLVEWSDGRALICTGTPFAPIQHRSRTVHIGQANNFYVFPALGLAVAASGARRVSDGMMRAAAAALAECSPALKDISASLLPSLGDIETVSKHIALAVGLAAQSEGLAPGGDEAQLRRRIDDAFWSPHYPQLIAAASPAPD
ncbi:MAG: NAD-dependent malic enzyme [Gammaproteobacteria bacterium]|nr:NAD-dependent malic enzyme [Gammaproteobacteria bacterium]